MEPITLIRTKLHRPPIPRDLVERPRLMRELNQGLERKLALVSAPAGYGKSTAVSAWVETLDLPAAWLSLDEYDDDLATFGAYLAEAVRTAYPGACQTCSPLLNASTLPPPHRLAEAFLIDLEALSGPLALVMDDYHTIQSADIHAFMQRVTHHLPAPVQLVVVTRQDPPLELPKLRAQRQMLEIDADDLSFTPEEARTLLSRLSGVSIDDEIVTLLSERTEGWPVGLQMAGISLRKSRDPNAFVRRFAQTRHHQLTEYLLSEVLSELTTAERAATLQVAIVDRFSADLCEAIVELPGGGSFDGEAFIRKLTRANLFTISLDDEGVWHRYHHLFRGLLQQRLQRTYTDEAVVQMHTRASAWFEANDILEAAIIHAIRGGDALRAARLVEQNFHHPLNQEDWWRIERWLNLLPKSVRQRPALLAVQALLAYFRWNLDAVESLLRTAEAGLEKGEATYSAQETQQIRGVIHTLRANVYANPDPEQVLHHIELAQKELGRNQTFLYGLGELWWIASLQQAGRAHEAIALAQARLLRQPCQPDVRTLRLLLAIGVVYFNEADLPSLEELGVNYRRDALEVGQALSLAFANWILGWVHYQRNELEAAESYFTDVVDVRFRAHGRATIVGLVELALTQFAQGRRQEAEETVSALRQLLWEYNMFPLLATADSLLMRFELADRRPGDGSPLPQPPKAFVMNPQAQLMVDMGAFPVFTAIRAYLLDGSAEKLAEAGDLLATCRAFAQSRHMRRQLMEIGTLETLLHAARGDDDAALDALRRAVRLGEAGGALRLFVDAGPGLRPHLQRLLDQGVAADYVRRILAAYAPEAPPARAHSAGRPLPDLTNREMDVLALLAQRLTNKEIADRLFLSPQTVKNYTHRLYQKFHVNNRRQVVAKARALGILSDPD